MGDDNITNEPDLTIVGGQPKRRRRSEGKVQVPVGLEKILFHAARDTSFKKLLLADRDAAIEKSGVSLRPSEHAMLSVATDDALEVMIAKINPSNPKKRKFMGLVAAAATSLAAGTAVIASGCDNVSADNKEYGVDAGTGSDIDTDTDTDTDSDTDTEQDAGDDSGDTDTVDIDTETDFDGIRPDTDTNMDSGL